jgi:dihydrofolate synthase/folylpolyglutamate synthase
MARLHVFAEPVTYVQAIQFLYDLGMFGARLGLDVPHRLAALAGNPEQKLRFIHVAGTNGKGSTCAMLESIYREAGLRVGLFTSPHLVSFAERMQVNRRPASEAAVVRLVEALKPLVANFPDEQHPTFFEAVTIMALRYFLEQRCELIIWETGLGGRLDATNIVMPLASVITTIDFDHQHWLGPTLDQIAAEKAGIIKRNIPIITAAEPERGLEVISETAQLLQAPLTTVTRADTNSTLLRKTTLPLAGEHQRLNAAVAIATVKALWPQIPVTEFQIAQGLSRVSWPGRMQVVPMGPGRKLVLDGAHNAAGAAALCDTMTAGFPDQSPTLVLGVLEDKDWASIARTLAPLAKRILLVPVNSRRALPPEQLAPPCRAAAPTASIETYPSLKAALRAIKTEALVLLTGSLYLVGEAMELLELYSVPAKNERGLNEWGSTPGTSR